jgi:C4-type Zn-finger protein
LAIADAQLHIPIGPGKESDVKKKNPSNHATVSCPVCGDEMRLRWMVPDPQSPELVLRQFSCACGTHYGDKVPRELPRPNAA